ncbi:hypothetical protein Hanom_Chr00s000002g01599021 [Helianthus anomalus]
MGTITKSYLVLKTKIPTEENCSPGNSLQNMDSGIDSRCISISGTGGSCKPVETKNGSMTVSVTAGLEFVETSTSLLGT